MEEAWFLTAMSIREADTLMSLLAVSQDCETRRPRYFEGIHDGWCVSVIAL